MQNNHSKRKISLPNFNAHKRMGYIASILFSIIFTYFFHNDFPIQLTDWRIFLIPAVIYLYSNLPDIDHHMSRLRKYIFRTIFLGLALSTLLIAVFGINSTIGILTIIGIAGLIVLRLKHRGITHSYPFIFIAALPLVMIHWFIFALALVSGITHIFVDRLYSGFKRKVKKNLGISTANHFYFRF